MPATLSRSLLLSFALALAAPAIAQTNDKDAQAAPKQGTAKSSSATKPTAASKRLDFVPSTNVKPTATRPAAPTPAQPPAKQDWHHCDHESVDA